MQLAELDAVITRLENEVREKQKDLDIARQFRAVLPRLGNQNSPPVEGSSPKQIPLMPEEGSYGAISDTVREAIKKCPTHYTVREVESAISQFSLMDLSRDVIAQVLHRLTQKGELKVLTKGAGRRATVYTKD